jgi:hypothetical protein
MLKLALAQMWLRMSAVHPAYFSTCLYEQPGPWGRIPTTSLQSAWDRYKFHLTSVQARIKVWLYDWDISSIVDMKASRYLDSVLSATLTRTYRTIVVPIDSLRFAVVNFALEILSFSRTE